MGIATHEKCMEPAQTRGYRFSAVSEAQGYNTIVHQSAVCCSKLNILESSQLHPASHCTHTLVHSPSLDYLLPSPHLLANINTQTYYIKSLRNRI